MDNPRNLHNLDGDIQAIDNGPSPLKRLFHGFQMVSEIH